MDVVIGLFPFVLGLVIYLGVMAGTEVPAMVMRRKFRKLGEVEGRNRLEILSVVGQPHSETTDGEGKTLCQWITSGYHVALLFDGDRCERIARVINHSA
jgi:hypothetical protein